MQQVAFLGKLDIFGFGSIPTKKDSVSCRYPDFEIISTI